MELFTACCRRGQLLLKDDEHKKIVLQSIAFLCRDQRIRLFGYVILEDEFHLLWEKQPDWQAKNIRQMMLKFTAQQIKYRLLRTRSPELEKYKSTLNDRHYHFWDKATYFRQIPSIQMAEETIRHLHEAPVLTGLSPSPEMYAFSSARFYQESFHSTISPIADTYIDITESAKTYDLTVVEESEGHSKRETINIPEGEKAYGLSVTGASERHSEGETIDAAEKLAYAAAEDPKSMAEAEAPETRDTQDYHKLRQLVFKREHVPHYQTDKVKHPSTTTKLIYGSLNLSGIIRPGPVNGVSIVSPVKGEKENSAVITNFRVVFKVLKNDSG
jgi:REP element-mobilizing transposase RayT